MVKERRDLLTAYETQVKELKEKLTAGTISKREYERQTKSVAIEMGIKYIAD